MEKTLNLHEWYNVPSLIFMVAEVLVAAGQGAKRFMRRE